MRPTDLHETVPRISLLKRISRYQVEVSLIRTNNNHAWQSPFIGMNAFDLTAPVLRENSAKLYAAVLDHPVGVMLNEDIISNSGKQRAAQSLYLPLTDTAGQPTYILSCSAYVRKAQYHNTNERLMPNHADVMTVDFIDIGAGVPAVTFDPIPAVKSSTSHLSHQWWSRFLPGWPKPRDVLMGKNKEPLPQNKHWVTGNADEPRKRH